MKHFFGPITLELPLRMTHFIPSHQMNGPNRPQHQPISSTRPTGYSIAAIELMGFKKGTKREIAAYPFLREVL